MHKRCVRKRVRAWNQCGAIVCFYVFTIIAGFRRQLSNMARFRPMRQHVMTQTTPLSDATLDELESSETPLTLLSLGQLEKSTSIVPRFGSRWSRVASFPSEVAHSSSANVVSKSSPNFFHLLRSLLPLLRPEPSRHAMMTRCFSASYLRILDASSLLDQSDRKEMKHAITKA